MLYACMVGIMSLLYCGTARTSLQTPHYGRTFGFSISSSSWKWNGGAAFFAYSRARCRKLVGSTGPPRVNAAATPAGPCTYRRRAEKDTHSLWFNPQTLRVALCPLYEPAHDLHCNAYGQGTAFIPECTRCPHNAACMCRQASYVCVHACVYIRNNSWAYLRALA